MAGQHDLCLIKVKDSATSELSEVAESFLNEIHLMLLSRIKEICSKQKIKREDYEEGYLRLYKSHLDL